MLLKKGKTFFLQKREKASVDPLVIIHKTSNRRVVEASNVSSVLLKIKGFWLFDWYPDELIIEEKRVILKRRYFPFFETINTIPVNRITIFEVTHSLFFSGIHIKGSYGDGIDTTFQWLGHNDAQQAKHVLDGLRIKESESVEIIQNDQSAFTRTLQIIGGIPA